MSLLVQIAEKEKPKERSSDEVNNNSRLLWQLERLQRHSDQLKDERESLIRDVDVLKDALEKVKERSAYLLTMGVKGAFLGQ
jgi:cell division protein FtsB